MGKFDGKIALVTGATSGIGRETARQFANEGAFVIIVGRNIERGEKIQKEILCSGGKALFIKCDVSDENQIIELKNKVENEFGRLDILFNNAGIWLLASLDEISSDFVNNVFSSNLNSIIFMSKYFMPLLKKSKGNIINNASMGGLDGFVSGKNQYVYASSKAGVIKFSKLMAKNYAKEVRVNCICPGIIETEIYTNRDFSRFNDSIPMERVGSPREVADVVLFLASDEASYLTGVILPIDGGASLM